VFELQCKGKRLKFGAGLTGVATVASLLGAATLVATAVLALARVVPGWLSALIIGGGLLLFAGLAALVSGSRSNEPRPRPPKRLSTESGKTWTRSTHLCVAPLRH
jgi:hypothetical protein